MKHGMLLFSITLLAAMAVEAQTTATISGTVSDQGGGLVAGAAVTVTNLDTQQNRELRTDASGHLLRAGAQSWPPAAR